MQCLYLRIAIASPFHAVFDGYSRVFSYEASLNDWIKLDIPGKECIALEWTLLPMARRVFHKSRIVYLAAVENHIADSDQSGDLPVLRYSPSYNERY